MEQCAKQSFGTIVEAGVCSAPLPLRLAAFSAELAHKIIAGVAKLTDAMDSK